MRLSARGAAAALAFLSLESAANAHPGHWADPGDDHGLLHALTGLDLLVSVVLAGVVAVLLVKAASRRSGF